MISIVIPVKNPVCLRDFVQENLWAFKEYPLIVIDSGGGELLQSFAQTYIKKDLKFWEARKLGYQYVKTKYILNLDSDVIIPKGYLKEAIKLLERNIDAVSIFYEDVGHCQGALEFGISIWKTDVLKKLYDFSMEKVQDGKIVKVGSMAYSTLNNGWCECTYMWRKLKFYHGRLETLPFRAKHLKERRGERNAEG